MKVVERELLEAVAATNPKKARAKRQGARGGRFDLPSWIDEYKVPVRREGVWNEDGYRWVLEACPWNDHVDNSAYIVQFADGAIAAGCHHNSCQGYDWKDLREHYDPGGSKEQKPSQASILVELAGVAELFRDPEGEAFATVPVGGHFETHRLRTKGFTRWLQHRFYEAQRKAPGAQALQDATGTLEARALFDGEEREVHVRIAGHGDNIYLDLCNEEWEVVEITPSGWRVLAGHEAPVRFRRASGMLPLPTPTRGGDLAGLRRLLNLSDDASWALVLSWLVAALWDEGPFPILVVLGEQGSAKSTTLRMLRTLVDPNMSEVRATPRNDQDLAIAAKNSRVLAYDNLSYIAPWLSDALCRISTGGGLGGRRLYTDDEEALFWALRPVAVNGITDVATRPDILDRSVVVRLPVITEYQPEKELWAEFHQAHPGLLGALLDGVSAALVRRDSVEPPGDLRMIDFARWAVAAEEGLGLKKGEFLAAYAGARADATNQMLEHDPVAQALFKFMGSRREWESSGDELRTKLSALVEDDVRRSKSWPGGALAFSNKMKRLAPALRSQGLVWEDLGKSGPTRKKRLYWLDSHGPTDEEIRASEMGGGPWRL
ncbi:MAG: hypothetical protein M3R38_04785 [Actinomycetota bacterium]|nr:hypothetical protein [Actinomycetota bacterium]